MPALPKRYVPCTLLFIRSLTSLLVQQKVVRGDYIAKVYIEGPVNRTIHSINSILVTARLQLSLCTATEPDITYLWQQTSGPQAAPFVSDSLTLYLPPYSLRANSINEFTFNALHAGEVIASISVTIRVLSTPALIVVSGHGTHTRDEAIKVAVEKIIDFDDDLVLTPNELVDAHYKWAVVACPNKPIDEDTGSGGSGIPNFGFDQSSPVRLHRIIKFENCLLNYSSFNSQSSQNPNECRRYNNESYIIPFENVDAPSVTLPGGLLEPGQFSFRVTVTTSDYITTRVIDLFILENQNMPPRVWITVRQTASNSHNACLLLITLLCTYQPLELVKVTSENKLVLTGNAVAPAGTTIVSRMWTCDSLDLTNPNIVSTSRYAEI